MQNIYKSIGAGIVGIVVGAVLSVATDKLLEANGVLPHGNLYVSAALIWFVLFYRTAFNTLGFFLTAKLAPQKPMKHALILGVIGTLVSAIAAITTKDMNLGPSWYAWTLAALTMPAAYLGGKIALMFRGN